MPSALDNLIGLSLVAIEDATNAYLRTGDLATWRASMGRAIGTAHQAALLTATAERGAGGKIRNAFARLTGASPEALLSKQDRAALRSAVEGQLKYLDGVQRDIAAGRLSPAQIAARANLYGPSIRPFYYAMRWGDWQIPDRLIPGNQACLGNCRCTISVADNGDGTGVLTRVLGGERHCTECPPLAGDHQVRRRDA
jgi:hypothetical protein